MSVTESQYDDFMDSSLALRECAGCQKSFRPYEYDDELEDEYCLCCVKDEEDQAAMDGLMGDS